MEEDTVFRGSASMKDSRNLSISLVATPKIAKVIC